MQVEHEEEKYHVIWNGKNAEIIGMKCLLSYYVIWKPSHGYGNLHKDLGRYLVPFVLFYGQNHTHISMLISSYLQMTRELINGSQPE